MPSAILRVEGLALALRDLTGGARCSFLQQLMSDLVTIKTDLGAIGAQLTELRATHQAILSTILMWKDMEQADMLPTDHAVLLATARNWTKVQGLLSRINCYSQLVPHS